LTPVDGLTNLAAVGGEAASRKDEQTGRRTLVDVRFAYHANCWGPLGGNAVGVTSIGQLTYQTFGDMGRAIAEIGAVGYQGVELFDGNLVDYPGGTSALKSALAGAGVTLVAAYSGANFIFPEILGQELGRIARVADAAALLSAEHLVVGGGAKRLEGVADGDYGRLATALEKVVEIAKERGLKAHYHPHLSTIVEGPAEVDRIFSSTSIDFCPDTAHLAAAGGDVAAMIRKHRDRISYVHLKGLRKAPFGFTPLDEGDLDIAGIISALAETRYSGWIAAELDAWPDPREGAARSLAFLKRKIAA
jgi:inosose dehydratase